VKKLKDINKCKLNNLDFLKLDTKEKCYLMGLLFADGYIECGRKSGVWCYLVKDDMYEIKDLLSDLMPFSFYVRKMNGNRKQQIGAYINSTHLANALLETDFATKSLKFSFMGCDEIFKKHFLRGYFDGDGCFFIKKYINNKSGKLTYVRSFNVSSSYETDWTLLTNFLDELNIEYRIVRYKYDKSSFSRIVVTKKSSLKQLIEFIYWGYDNIGFNRKYNKAIEILDSIK
jgi:hypothetical protein